MISSRWLPLFLLALGPLSAGAADITVNLRSRVEVFKGSGEWREVRLQQSLALEKTGVLICDMWDRHWCRGATERVNGLVRRIAPFLEAARNQGIQIIHAPSETMAFYQDAPQRKRMLAVANIEPPTPLSLPDPPLPIEDKSGGCDTSDQFFRAWTREHPGIRIDTSDVISDSGPEIYSFIRERGIRTLLVMGVHTNMCVLNRTFAIKKMTALGIRCILVRDLTDAMYNPQDPPHVTHEAGTQLVIEYIEKYWCPTTTSADFSRHSFTRGQDNSVARILWGPLSADIGRHLRNPGPPLSDWRFTRPEDSMARWSVGKRWATREDPFTQSL